MAYTFWNPKYERAKVMKTVKIDGVDYYLNIFDTRIMDLMRNITQFRQHPYDSSIPLTTVSHRYYGTTTLDWVIIMYNGYIHEFEIPDGTIMRIPSLSNVGRVFADVRQPSQVGQVTTI